MKHLKLGMKFLHEVGSYGLAGGFAAQLLVLASTEGATEARLVEALCLWIVMPSLVLNLVSGVLAMVLRPIFFSKEWVWLKVLLTVPTVYPAVATFPGILTGVEERLGGMLWLALVASLVITVFSVWRPKGFILGS